MLPHEAEYVAHSIAYGHQDLAGRRILGGLLIRSKSRVWKQCEKCLVRRRVDLPQMLFL